MHPRIQTALRAALLERAGIATGRTRPGARPCIVKPVGAGRRTRASVVRLLDYIARADRLSTEERAAEEQAADAAGAAIRPGDAVAIFDEWSNEVPHSDRDAVLAGWPSMEGSDSHRVRARHLVFTVPIEHPEDAGRVEVAVAAAIRETLGTWGHPVLWALHTDHADHPHVHAVVGTPPDVPLRFERDALLLDALRAALARNARGCGFDVSAERRCDRPDAQRPLMKELDTLEQRVPKWVAGWGAGYVERVLAGNRASVADPTVIERSRTAMAAEDRTLALWYERNRPIVFGAPGRATWPEVRTLATGAAAAKEAIAARAGLEQLARAFEQYFPPGEADRLAAAIRARAANLDKLVPPTRFAPPSVDGHRPRRDHSNER